MLIVLYYGWNGLAAEGPLAGAHSRSHMESFEHHTDFCHHRVCRSCGPSDRGASTAAWICTEPFMLLAHSELSASTHGKWIEAVFPSVDYIVPELQTPTSFLLS